VCFVELQNATLVFDGHADESDEMLVRVNEVMWLNRELPLDELHEFAQVTKDRFASVVTPGSGKPSGLMEYSIGMHVLLHPGQITSGHGVVQRASEIDV